MIRRLKRDAAACLLLALLLACQGREPLSMLRLKPALSEVPGAQRIEIKSEIDVRAFPQDQAPVAVRGLRQLNVVESAYYKYHLAQQPAGSYKLKLTIYSDEASRRQAWALNYPPQLLEGAQDRSWGEVGFVVPGKAGAFAQGRVIAHVESSGSADQLDLVLQTLLRRSQQLLH